MRTDKNYFIPEKFEIQRRINDSKYYFKYKNEKGNTVYFLEDSNVLSTTEYENKPRTGFKMVESTYSYVNYHDMIDGVLIADPRGFEFKISIANFLHLVKSHNIENGEIKAKCILVWSGKGNASLVSTSSELYTKAISYTNKTKTVFDGTLHVGKTYTIKKNNDEYLYIGNHKFHSSNDNYIFDFNLKNPKNEKPVFYNTCTKEFCTFMISRNIVDSSSKEAIDCTDLIKEFKNSKEGRILSTFQCSESSEIVLITNEASEYNGYVGFIDDDTGDLVLCHYFNYNYLNFKDKDIKLYFRTIENKNSKFSENDNNNWQIIGKFNLNTKPIYTEEELLKYFNAYGFGKVTVVFEDELSDCIVL